MSYEFIQFNHIVVCWACDSVKKMLVLIKAIHYDDLAAISDVAVFFSWQLQGLKCLDGSWCIQSSSSHTPAMWFYTHLEITEKILAIGA